MQRTAFKKRELFQYIICRRDYSERVAARFSHQIQLKYYGRNLSVFKEGIALENFSVLPKADINSNTPSRQLHAVFHSFLSDYIKQYADTTTAHINRLISLLKNKKVLTTSISTIWGNTDDFCEQYICDSALYLMSVMSQCYSIIIY